MTKVLDYIFEVTEFEFQSCYYIHFRLMPFEKLWNLFYLQL